ncbi:MAG: hypothetical protein ACYTAN_09765 [Planctomycetota bacterium]|jgi:hypothetical protein
MSMIPSGIKGWTGAPDPYDPANYEAAMNRIRWWEQPGLTFDARPPSGRLRPGTSYARLGGLVEPFAVQIPGEFQPEFGTDAQSFYEFMQSSPSWMQQDVRSRGRASNEAAAARQTAVRGLQRMFGDVEELRTGFREDPNRAAMGEAFRARTEPGYEIISDLEEGAMRNQLAQTWAREQAAREASAAGRGTLGGGPSLHNLAGLRAIAASGGVQLGAQVEAANRLARERALGDLGAFTDRGVALEQNFSRIMGGIQSEIARLEAGGDAMYTDYGAYEAARFGQEQFDQQMEQAERAMALYEETQRTDVLDLVELLVASIGSGVWDVLS